MKRVYFRVKPYNYYLKLKRWKKKNYGLDNTDDDKIEILDICECRTNGVRWNRNKSNGFVSLFQWKLPCNTIKDETNEKKKIHKIAQVC